MKIKRLTAALLIFVMLLSLSGCGKSKEFRSDELTITLTDDFVKKNNEEAAFYYEGPDVAVLGTKTSSADLEMTGDEETDSLIDYVHVFMEANGIDQSTEIVEKKNYYYIETSEKLGGTEYAYLISFYENGEDYWVVRFACYKEAYGSFKKYIKKWAKSVSFDGED